MSTDILIRGEKKVDGVWVCTGKLYLNQSYALFGWLANVRNYSDVIPLAQPRGFPRDVSPETRYALEYNSHSFSWYTLAELRAVDYTQLVTDKRGPFYSGDEIHDTLTQPLNEFLGEEYFSMLDEAEKAGAERIVFAFDC